MTLSGCVAKHDLKPVLAEAEQKTSALQDTPQDYLHDPYILDFLNLPAGSVQENELERKYPVRSLVFL